MSDTIFMQGDKVYYTGEKLKQQLTSKEGKPFVGWIHAAVTNQPGAWVVEFPDTKESDSFIISEANLSKYRPSKAELQAGPDIQPRRRKREDTE